MNNRSYAARDLDGTDIGKRIRILSVHHTSKTELITTGQIWEIRHEAGKVFVDLGTSVSAGRYTLELKPNQLVVLDPSESAVNIVELRREM